MPFRDLGRVPAVREAGEGLHVTSERSGPARTVAVRGELDLHTVPQLRLELADAVQTGAGPVILDLRDVGFIDSTGIAALLNALRRLTRAGRRLVLVVDEDGAVWRMMRVARLDGTFRVHFSVRDALADALRTVAA